MKPKTTKIFVLTALAALTVPSTAQIINGSFETGVAYGGSPNINIPGTPSPWVATNFTPDCYDNTGVDGWGLNGIPVYDNMFRGMVAADGTRFIGFAAGLYQNTPISESFMQVMNPLTPGQTYTVNAMMAVDDLGKAAAYSGPYTGRGVIDVLINGSYVGTFGANTQSLTWEARSVTFVAPVASSYTIEFVASMGTLPASPSYMALDGINMVPEPGTILAFGAGAAALARRRFNRRGSSTE